jgi:hypothetical protein
MAIRAKAAFDEKELTKGQLRKLNALRKSIGPDIAERAFAEWLANQPAEEGGKADPVAEKVADRLWKLVQEEDLTFPRGGYLVRRGRGRIVVEPAKSE